MDWSLQLDKRQDVKSPQSSSLQTKHSHAAEIASEKVGLNCDLFSDELEHNASSFPGTQTTLSRPRALGVGPELLSDDPMSSTCEAHTPCPSSDVTSASALKRPDKPSALPPSGTPYPSIHSQIEYEARINTGVETGIEQNDSKSMALGMSTNCTAVAKVPESPANDTSSQKVPSSSKPFADIQDTHHLRSLDDFARRRSRSIGSTSRDSRIAALSVQLRTRLSYAAAKVEKRRQSHTIAGLLHSNSSTPVLSAEASALVRQPSSVGEIENQGSAGASSASGTTVPTPDSPKAASPRPLDASARLSSINSTNSLRPPSQSDPRIQSRISSLEEPIPRLAPPADIVSSHVNSPRRRPNPNFPPNASRYTPFPLHRRHRSQQELGMDTDVDLVPETPPFGPSTHSMPVPYEGMNNHSQNASMEQDAIETLLFMSSPGNSGYHSNSQNSPHLQGATHSIAQGTFPGGHTTGRPSGQAGGLGAEAGDEIDLMLDQMSSDCDDSAGREDRA